MQSSRDAKLCKSLAKVCVDRYIFVCHCRGNCSSSHAPTAAWLWCCLASPSSPALSFSMWCSDTLHSFCSALPHLHATEKLRDTKSLISIMQRRKSQPPETRCSVAQTCTLWPCLCYSWSVWKLSPPLGKCWHGSLWPVWFWLRVGMQQVSWSTAPLLFGLRERRFAWGAGGRWGGMRSSEYPEVAHGLSGHCQSVLLTNGNCMRPAQPLPRHNLLQSSPHCRGSLNPRHFGLPSPLGCWNGAWDSASSKTQCNAEERK